MNPLRYGEYFQSFNGITSSSSLRLSGSMKANSSYDQLVDLDPTCNQGLFHGQEKITDLEKSLFELTQLDGIALKVMEPWRISAENRINSLLAVEQLVQSIEK